MWSPLGATHATCAGPEVVCVAVFERGPPEVGDAGLAHCL